MTTSDVKTVLSLYEAFARRDLDTIRAAFAEEAVTEQSSLLPWGGRHIGPDGFVAFLGTLLSHIEPTLEIGPVFDAGDVVVQIGHTRGRVLAHGNEYRVPEVHTWRLQDGKVTAFRAWVDVPAMRAALAGE